MWHLRTLGQLSLHPEGPESEPVIRNAKALGVLGYLAGIPGHTARRSHVAELFWPGADTRRGRRSLRQAIYYLSKKADAELVRSDAEELALASERLDVDLWDFDAALEEGRYETAVDLYGGPFLEGFQRKAGRELEGWIEAENERIWGGLKMAYQALVTAARQEGRPERAARHARGYVQLNPLDERAQVALIRSLLEAGEEVAAYRAYERYRTLLREELGAEPGEELDGRLRELQTELFGGDDAWGGPRARGPGPDAAGPDAPGSGDASRPERRGTPDRRLWVGVGATAVVLAAAALAASWLGAADEEPRTAWQRVDADLLALRESDTEASWHVAIREGAVSVDRSDLGWSELGDPTGRRVAAVRRASSGPDVVIRERDGPTIPVTATRWDEHPVAWAPDGRYLVFRRGFLQEDAPGLRYVAYLCSVETGEVQRLADLELTGPRPVVWSPTGTHLALAAVGPDGDPEVYRLEVDGGGLTRLTSDDARDEEPAWSPGGERLAFVSWRTARPHVWVVDADGANLEQVTFGSARARSPAWVSDHHLVFLSDRDGTWDLWSLDLVSRRTRRLTDLGDFRPGELLRWHRTPPGRMVERVAIRPRPRAVSPGQHLRLEARGLTRDGTEIPAARRVLRWTVGDSSVLAPVGDGYRVRREGEARVVASVGGWRADTLHLASVPLRALDDLPVLFEEDWDAGISPSVWRVEGTPEPYTTPVAAASLGPEASGDGGAAADGGPLSPPPVDRAFVSNGDENYGSGLVTREALELTGGVTLSFRASLPFDPGTPYQTFQVGLRSAASEPDDPSVRLAGGDLLQLGLSATDRYVHITGTGVRDSLPELSRPDLWHRYALQVAPDGRASLVRDDTLVWRSAPGFVSVEEPARLVLGGRSVGVETLVGPLRVHAGERWILDLGDGERS